MLLVIKIGLSSVGYASSIYQLDPFLVVSTATRTDRLVADLPVRTEVLGYDLIKAGGSRDLASAMDYLPGARVEANCQNCGTTELKLLGLGAGYNQILFDGHPMFSGLAAVYGLEHIPTAFIERIEVVKGGASSLYGPGAVAGVVNIIPRRPVKSGVYLESAYEVAAGKPALTNVGIFDGVRADNLMAASLYAQHSDSSAIDLNADGFSDITDKQFTSIGSHSWWYPVRDALITANYSYTAEERRGGDSFHLLPHETRITESLEHRWHRGGVAWAHDLSPDFSYQIATSVSYIERDSYYGGIGGIPGPGAPGFDQDLYAAALDDARLLYGYTETTRYYLDSLFSHHLGYHQLSWGIQYQQDVVFDEKRNDAGQPLRTDGSVAARKGEDPIADDSFSNLGFFIQDEWNPSALWTVIVGARLDSHSMLNNWVASPRIAVRHTATREWVFRASVATGFRAPEIFDEDFHIEILDDPVRTRNSPALKEESSVSWAGGFIWTPLFAGQRLQVNGELFFNDLRDAFDVAEITYQDSNGMLYKLRENVGDASVKGFEINVAYRFNAALSLQIGTSFVDARFGDAREVLPDTMETGFLETPRWSGVARLVYENEDLVDLFLGVIYTGSMMAVNETEAFINRDTESFIVVNANITRHVSLAFMGSERHLDITAGVRSIFDARQGDLPMGARRDTGYFYGPRSPRSFFLKASLLF